MDAFSGSQLPSHLVKWVATQNGMGEEIDGPKFSTPIAFISNSYIYTTPSSHFPYYEGSAFPKPACLLMICIIQCDGILGCWMYHCKKAMWARFL